MDIRFGLFFIEQINNFFKKFNALFFYYDPVKSLYGNDRVV